MKYILCTDIQILCVNACQNVNLTLNKTTRTLNILITFNFNKQRTSMFQLSDNFLPRAYNDDKS